MKKIAVLTATRAEYGLLSPVIKQLRTYENDDFRVELIVTGTHLSNDYGFTVNEIVQAGVRIDKEVQIPVHSNGIEDIAHNQAVTLTAFTHLFTLEKYDAVLLLGDRYETLMIAIAASNTHTPIFHMCGGDTTEGAMDEWIRHSITKMSYLHFVTNEDSKKRVIQLGETPERVYNFGSTSIDNILAIDILPKKEVLQSIGMPECDYILGTYHPVTLGNEAVYYQMEAFFDAIECYPDIQFIITKSNADAGGATINKLLDKATSRLKNLHVFASLGMRRYLSLMKYAKAVIGNSSSGIIETPSFHVPTINIGDRQRGRLQAENVLNCDSSADAIKNTLEIALNNERFLEICHCAVSPYGDGHASEKIAKKSWEFLHIDKIDLKKKFYMLK